MAGGKAQIEVHGLVLRKQPWSETSLIVTVLSPDEGRVSLLARGALKLTQRHFPELDALRWQRLRYRPNRVSDLHTLTGAETLRDFGALAAWSPRYQAAAWLARLALAVSAPRTPAPQLTKAMLVAFSRLEGWTRAAPLAGLAITLPVAFVAMWEHGVLPEAPSAATAAAQHALLAAALEPDRPLPAYDRATWLALSVWVAERLDEAGLAFPDHWARLEPEAPRG